MSVPNRIAAKTLEKSCKRSRGLTEREWSSERNILLEIRDLSIWLPVGLYKRCPILFPFLVRGRGTKRGVPARTARDAWGAPDESGFFRDDNSMVKGFVRSLSIQGNACRLVDGQRLGKGFTACHIWQSIRGTDSQASKYYKTYSFVPNLVWLPRDLGLKSDEEGSPAQRYLKSLSYRIYGRRIVGPHIKNLWSPLTGYSTSVVRVEPRRLNFFRMTNGQISDKVSLLKRQIATIRNVRLSGAHNEAIYKELYLRRLRRISPNRLVELYEWLDEVSRFTH